VRRATARCRAEGKRYCGGVNGEPKLIPIEFDLRADIDVVLTARSDEAIAAGTQELHGLEHGQARERVEQRQLAACLRQHENWQTIRKGICHSVGRMNFTLQLWASVNEIRDGSTILTSDSRATNVVMRILSSEVFSTTW
jgi:hypothetical protein